MAPECCVPVSWQPTGKRVLEIKDGTRTTSTFDPANQNVYSESASGRTTCTFDADGNRTVVDMSDDSRTATTYDYKIRDIRIQLPTGIVNAMQYDADGLGVQLEDSTGTTKFVYDNQQYLLQTDGSIIFTVTHPAAGWGDRLLGKRGGLAIESTSAICSQTLVE